MKKIENAFNHIISFKFLAILLCIAVCCLLFPILLLGRYDIPELPDDYRNSFLVHECLLNNGSFSDVLRVTWDYVIETYYKWQGSASAVFLFALQPGVFGEEYYAFVPWIMLGMLLLGLFFFAPAFFSLFSKDKHKSQKELMLILICVITILFTQFLPSPAEGFYWYVGAVYYTFFFGLSLLLYTLMIKLALISTTWKKILLFIFTNILCVLIGFSNYVTALVTFIILVSEIFYLFTTKNKNRFWFLIPLVLFTICFWLNASAPGNGVRQEGYAERPSVFGTIWLSMQCTITRFYQWNTIPVLALYLFLVPILWKMASESDYSFRMPWLVSLFSFGLQVSMNCPTYYAYMWVGPGRIEDIRFYAMVLLIVINLFYWEGWFAKKLNRKITQRMNGLKLSFLIGVSLLFAAGLVLSEQPYTITSIEAFKSYRSGEAGLYKYVFNQRLDILRDPEIRDAKLREFPQKPYLLFINDLDYDPNQYENVIARDYYHKDSVRLMTHEEFEASLNQ